MYVNNIQRTRLSEITRSSYVKLKIQKSAIDLVSKILFMHSNQCQYVVLDLELFTSTPTEIH